MEFIGGPIPEPTQSELKLDPGFPLWEPQIEVNDRHRAFTHCLLRDFHERWRHLLRNDYNQQTMQHLARAIIDIAALDFEIRIHQFVRHEYGRVLVTNMSLPSWKQFGLEPFRLGRVWVVLCQNMANGLASAQEHFKRWNSLISGEARRAESEVLYMITSVKHIMLCRGTEDTALQHTTAQVPLFNGDYDKHPATDLALDYLIWAVSPRIPVYHARLGSLPVELQDMILKRTSEGPIEPARLGCLLSVGSTFSWKDDGWRRRGAGQTEEKWTVSGLEVFMSEKHYRRMRGTPVESEIFLDGFYSGVMYTARPPLPP
jgi:hypothetical protein